MSKKILLVSVLFALVLTSCSTFQYIDGTSKAEKYDDFKEVYREYLRLCPNKEDIGYIAYLERAAFLLIDEYRQKKPYHDEEWESQLSQKDKDDLQRGGSHPSQETENSPYMDYPYTELVIRQKIITEILKYRQEIEDNGFTYSVNYKINIIPEILNVQKEINLKIARLDKILSESR